MDHSRRGLRSEKKILKRLIYSIIFRFWAQCHLHGSCRYHFIYNLWLNLAGFLYTFLCFFVPKYTIIRCRTIQCSKMKNEKCQIPDFSKFYKQGMSISLLSGAMNDGDKTKSFCVKKMTKARKETWFSDFLVTFLPENTRKIPGGTRYSKVKDYPYPTRTRS